MKKLLLSVFVISMSVSAAEITGTCKIKIEKVGPNQSLDMSSILVNKKGQYVDPASGREKLRFSWNDRRTLIYSDITRSDCKLIADWFSKNKKSLKYFSTQFLENENVLIDLAE